MEPIGALGQILSFALPIIAGWLALRTMWPEGPLGMRLGLAAGLGTGFAGTVYSLTIAVTDSIGIALAATETILAAVILVLFARRAPDATRRALFQSGHDSRGLKVSFIVTAILAGTGLFLILDAFPSGGYDAIASWNLKARFMFTSEMTPLEWITRPELHDTQLDYPLLLPSLVTRGWQYAGRDSIFIPNGIALLYALSTLAVLMGGLRILSTRRQTWLGGCLLLGTPFFLFHAGSQYADILVAFFITAAVLLFCIHDRDRRDNWKLPYLAGLAAGFAACTKNEGLLFAAVLLGSRLLLAVGRRNWRNSPIEIGAVVSGLLPGLLAVAVFKAIFAPPNPLTAEFTEGRFVERLLMIKPHATILKTFAAAFIGFGRWLVPPLPMALAHVLISWRKVPWGSGSAWLTAALVVPGMLAGHYLVYLLTPYDLEWHLASSLDRLLVQIWPACIALYSMLADPASPRTQNLSSARTVAPIAAVLVALGAIAGLIVWVDARRPQIPPRLTLSHTVVRSGESYILKIDGMINSQVSIRYSINGEAVKTFVVQLDSWGETKLDVSDSTRTGSYRLIGFRKTGETAWTNADVEILVK
jgi:hypothetical protein